MNLLKLSDLGLSRFLPYAAEAPCAAPLLVKMVIEAESTFLPNQSDVANAAKE